MVLIPLDLFDFNISDGNQFKIDYCIRKCIKTRKWRIEKRDKQKTQFYNNIS